MHMQLIRSTGKTGRQTLLLWMGVIGGCTVPEDKVLESEPAPVEPTSPQGKLLIEEVFYAGSPPAGGRDHYFSDQFIRLRNIGAAPVAAGGLLVGNLHGLAGEINSGNTPNAYAEDPTRVAFSNLWRIPGAAEDYLVPPGGCLLIAQDAGQHAPYSEVDLWDADFETYLPGGDDVDDAVVPNLEQVFFTGGVDWLVTVFGPTMVVMAPVEDALLEPTSWYTLAPAEAVVDTMEALMDAESGAFKRLHPEIDAGFIHVSGTYTGESVRRLRDADNRLLDTDDSTADFVSSDQPDPGCTALDGS